MTSRRSFVGGLAGLSASLLAAPYVVRDSGLLMPVRKIIPVPKSKPKLPQEKKTHQYAVLMELNQGLGSLYARHNPTTPGQLSNLHIVGAGPTIFVPGDKYNAILRFNFLSQVAVDQNNIIIDGGRILKIEEIV